MFEDLSHTCDVVAAQLQEAARSARQGDGEGAHALIGRALELLRTGAKKPEKGPVRLGTPRVGGRSSLPAWRARQVKAYVDAHLAQSIHVRDLARVTGLSKGHFSRAFKAYFGVTTHAYITQRRMEAACHHLLNTSISLTQIALLCGMSDQSHFTRIFRKVFGDTPARWRRERVGAGCPTTVLHSHRATSMALRLEEGEEIGVDRPGLGRQHAVGEPLVGLEGAVLEQLRR